MAYKKQKRKQTAAQLYDAVFWSSVVKLTEFVVPLVNEVFGDSYSRDAVIELKPMKHITWRSRGRYSRRESDSLVRVTEGNISRVYHFECETNPDRSIAIRLAEYGSAAAYNSIRLTGSGARLEIPNSAVIFLKNKNNLPNKFMMQLSYPGGEVEYSIPVVRIQDYSLPEIFDKKLFLILPFYVFKLDGSFGMMDKTGDVSELSSMLKEVDGYLLEAERTKVIDRYQSRLLMRYTESVLIKLTASYAGISERLTIKSQAENRDF